MKTKNNIIIGVDFDGTVVSHEYPKIGKDIGAIPVLKKLIKNGHKLVLCTMRSKKAYNTLDEAVKWFKDNDIELFGVNRNPEQDEWTDSPKMYCNLYIDDAGLGCPLKFDEKISSRPFVDWDAVEDILESWNLLSK